MQQEFDQQFLKEYATCLEQDVPHVMKILKKLGFPKDNSSYVGVSLGCGATGLSEAIAIHKYQAGLRYVGLDINTQAIALNNTAKASLKTDDCPYSFFVADCTSVTAVMEKANIKKNSADLIILRHPNTHRETQIFEKIIDEVVPYFAKLNGKILVTNYYSKERDFVLKHMKSYIKEDSTKVTYSSDVCENFFWQAYRDHYSILFEVDAKKCKQHLKDYFQGKKNSNMDEIDNAWCGFFNKKNMAVALGVTAVVAGSVLAISNRFNMQ